MNSALRTTFACAAACVMLVPTPASAEQELQEKAADPVFSAFGTVLDEQSLASHRGGQQDAFFNDMRSRATISQTSTSNLATGTNTVSDGAFTNTNGLPMVIQNTGNNVIIQNSTILNLQLR